MVRAEGFALSLDLLDLRRIVECIEIQRELSRGSSRSPGVAARRILTRYAGAGRIVVRLQASSRLLEAAADFRKHWTELGSRKALSTIPDAHHSGRCGAQCSSTAHGESAPESLLDALARTFDVAGSAVLVPLRGFFAAFLWGS